MIAAEMPVDRVLAKLDGVRSSGRSWRARCPAHEDKRFALSVTVGDDDRALVRCFRGCETERVLHVLGLGLRDLFVVRNTSRSVTSRLNIRAFLEIETERARSNRLRRDPYDTPHIRSADVNVARRLASKCYGVRLAPIRSFAWEGSAPHDSDPLWPTLYSHAVDQAKWSAPNAKAAEIEIMATDLASEWLHAEARRHG